MQHTRSAAEPVARIVVCQCSEQQFAARDNLRHALASLRFDPEAGRVVWVGEAGRLVWVGWAPMSITDTPQYWRDRAEEARSISELMSNLARLIRRMAGIRWRM
jgi:hypothetical protein